MALLTALGVPTAGVQVVPGGPDWFHPGRSGTLQFGPKNMIGAFGEIHPKILQARSTSRARSSPSRSRSTRCRRRKPSPTKMKPKLTPVRLPAGHARLRLRGRRATWRRATSCKAAQGAERQLIAGVDVFDVYEGPGIDPDKKSVAIAVTLQPTEKTLTDAEIEAVSQKIVAEVAKKTGAVLRG